MQKFTLRPARLVVGRPVSPDSPSVCVGEDCGDISKSVKTLDSPDSRTEPATDLSDDVFVEDPLSAIQVCVWFIIEVCSADQAFSLKSCLQLWTL